MSETKLNGVRATKCRLNMSLVGAWWADVELIDERTIAGAVTLEMGGLRLVGAVISGGGYVGRSQYRCVGGAGKLGTVLPAKSYVNSAGVKAKTVILDAMNEAGERARVDASIGDARVGPAYARNEAPASRVLQQLASSWYVDTDGAVVVGPRKTSEVKTKVTIQSRDLLRATAEVAADDISQIVPGNTLQGLSIVDVQHESTPEGALRSTIWGPRHGAGSQVPRRLSALAELLEQLDPDRQYRAVWEYRVVSQIAQKVNLQIVNSSTGMPDLSLVPVRAGLPGANCQVALGSRVLVAFADASPSRPVVVAHEDWDGGGFKPILTEIDAQTVVKLGAGIKPVALAGDLAGGLFPIIPTQVKVLA